MADLVTSMATIDENNEAQTVRHGLVRVGGIEGTMLLGTTNREHYISPEFADRIRNLPGVQVEQLAEPERGLDYFATRSCLTRRSPATWNSGALLRRMARRSAYRFSESRFLRLRCSPTSASAALSAPIRASAAFSSILTALDYSCSATGERSNFTPKSADRSSLSIVFSTCRCPLRSIQRAK